MRHILKYDNQPSRAKVVFLPRSLSFKPLKLSLYISMGRITITPNLVKFLPPGP